MILQGDALTMLKELPGESVDCCITSPPYYGLRDYGVDGQIGLEETPEAYVDKLVEVFREVRRVLKKEGTCWVNLGDSYASSGTMDGVSGKSTLNGGKGVGPNEKVKQPMGRAPTPTNCKPKDLIGIPWAVAFALRADGWYLRSDIIWHKPNCMPESVTDRPTKAHEYLFLLSKSKKYYYDAEAVKEPLVSPPHAPGNKARFGEAKRNDFGTDRMNAVWGDPSGRNKRTVWTIPTRPFNGAKFGCDYVGSDGKPYKASPDCPIHSHLSGRRTSDSAEHGGPLASDQIHIPGIDAHPALRSSFEESPKKAHESHHILHPKQDSLQESNCGEQIPRNNLDYKKSDSHFESILGDQTPFRTSHIQGRRADQVDNSGSEILGCALIATCRNNESCKTDLALVTNPAYNSFEGISDHIEHRQAQPLYSSVNPDISESTLSGGFFSDEMGLGLSEQTLSHIADKQTISSPHICTCQVYNVDHFAVMPEALVEPCVLAGCPEGGLVLDPFFGAGTVGAVAARLGRRWIGIELNPEYIGMAKKRIETIPERLDRWAVTGA